jgi:cysteinyl-tRNA synthetase
MRIYNSLTRTKEEFTPLKKRRAGIYVCGPTVYDSPHIGHGRSAYIFDCVRRYLLYKKFKVTFVRNVTDVDDKIIEKARTAYSVQRTASNLENLTKEVAEKYLDEYHEDMGLLGIGRPDREPKATEYIPKMIKFIEILLKKGNAYVAGGDVYFDIKKAKDYGKLSNQSLEKMEVGARVSPGEKKRDGLDFALWKSAKEGEPSWPSPWGEGRPGWHIECSAMSSCLLGDEFDIHGGGIDLIFPHHENEIAQSEGAGKKFARYWMHNGLLTINGEKMAKSAGNFVTIKDFLARHGDPDYLKLFFLSAHYRSPIDYTEEKILEAKKEKERFAILFEKINRILKLSAIRYPLNAKKSDGDLTRFRRGCEQAMDDDFNTPSALAALFDLVTHANRLMHGKETLAKDELSAIAGAGALLLELGSVFGLDLSKEVARAQLGEGEIKTMIAERDKARLAKDFKKADSIRKDLDGMGVILEDTKDGTRWRVKA